MRGHTQIGLSAHARLGAGVECRRKLAERLFHHEGKKSPAHRDKLTAARRRPDDLYLRRRCDVVARRQVARPTDQTGEPVELFPGEMLREAATPDASADVAPNRPCLLVAKR
jgi:hypothetical protein